MRKNYLALAGLASVLAFGGMGCSPFNSDAQRMAEISKDDLFPEKIKYNSKEYNVSRMNVQGELWEDSIKICRDNVSIVYQVFAGGIRLNERASVRIDDKEVTDERVNAGAIEIGRGVLKEVLKWKQEYRANEAKAEAERQHLLAKQVDKVLF